MTRLEPSQLCRWWPWWPWPFPKWLSNIFRITSCHDLVVLNSHCAWWIPFKSNFWRFGILRLLWWWHLQVCCFMFHFRMVKVCILANPYIWWWTLLCLMLKAQFFWGLGTSLIRFLDASFPWYPGNILRSSAVTIKRLMPAWVSVGKPQRCQISAPGTLVLVSWGLRFFAIYLLGDDWNMTAFYVSILIGNFIVPIGELIFFRGVGIPPSIYHLLK